MLLKKTTCCPGCMYVCMYAYVCMYVARFYRTSWYRLDIYWYNRLGRSTVRLSESKTYLFLVLARFCSVVCGIGRNNWFTSQIFGGFKYHFTYKKGLKPPYFPIIQNKKIPGKFQLLDLIETLF